MMTQDQAYKILELNPNATIEEVRSCFKELFNEFQMRITNAPTEGLKNTYKNKLAEIELAYKTLTQQNQIDDHAELPLLAPPKNSFSKKSKEIIQEETIVNTHKNNAVSVSVDTYKSKNINSKLKQIKLKIALNIIITDLERLSNENGVNKYQTEMSSIIKIYNILIPSTNDLKFYKIKLPHLISFDGRIRRTQYGLTLILVFILFLLILKFYAQLIFIIENQISANIILGVVSILMFCILLAQGSKRCHDIGKNGWWQFIPFYFFVLIFKKGDSGDNQYSKI